MNEQIINPGPASDLDFFKHVFKNTGSIILIIEQDSTISKTNLDGSEYFGFKEKNLIGSTLWLDNLQLCDKKIVQQYLKEHQEKKDGAHSFTCEFRAKGGNIIFLQKRISAIPHSNRFIVSVIDTTEHKIAEIELMKTKKLASFYEFHDHLTQLPNRELFHSRLEMELRTAKRRNKFFAVICLGLDNLKAINEIYGPSNGDHILQSVSASLKGLYRNDDLVSRFVGDKFMILLADIKSADHVLPIVEKTLQIFHDPIPICGEEITLSASIGVSIFPTDGSTSEEITKNAETAMFTAKKHRRGGYQLFDPGMHAIIEKNFRLTQEMHEGIQKGEFIPYYQPKVDPDGKLAGMEALVRWNNPRRGTLNPIDFISLAESNGMIIDIGFQVLESACKQVLEWAAKGSPLIQVAVNLSPVQFQQKDLVDQIKALLKKTGLPSKFLELEITESGIIQNEKEAIKKLKALLDIGIDIAIDDFGTGYSSLYRLQDYPVTRLKIDKSFLDRIHTNPKTSTITMSIIEMAHKLGFQVVAEGVEHCSQYELLKDNLCDYFQGFYFDKPLHPKMIEENWLFTNQN